MRVIREIKRLGSSLLLLLGGGLRHDPSPLPRLFVVGLFDDGRARVRDKALVDVVVGRVNLFVRFLDDALRVKVGVVLFVFLSIIVSALYRGTKPVAM